MPDHEKEKEREKDKDKEKHTVAAAAEPAAASTHAITHATTHATAPVHPAAVPPTGKNAEKAEDDASGAFFAAPLVGFDASEISGTLIVIEGLDGSGRSTQISLLQEWLESEGFAVQTSGLRRSKLVGGGDEGIVWEDAGARVSLALMCCKEFFDDI